jgi:hypothetical protein
VCGLARGEMQRTGQRHAARTTGLLNPRQTVRQEVLAALTTKPGEKCGPGGQQDSARGTAGQGRLGPPGEHVCPVVRNTPWRRAAVDRVSPAPLTKGPKGHKGLKGRALARAVGPPFGWVGSDPSDWSDESDAAAPAGRRSADVSLSEPYIGDEFLTAEALLRHGSRRRAARGCSGLDDDES